jgi:hypothetical protein
MKNDEKNIDDQELDGVFREAARSYSPGFQESDWLAMSELLDKNPISEPTDNPFKFRKKWLLALLVGLGLLSSLGWFYVNKSSESIVVNQKETDRISNDKNERNIISENAGVQKLSKAKIEESQVEKLEEKELISDEKPDSAKEGSRSVNKVFSPIAENQKMVLGNEGKINSTKKKGESLYAEEVKTTNTEKAIISEAFEKPFNRPSELLRNNIEVKATEKTTLNNGIEKVHSPIISSELGEVNERTTFVTIKTLESKLPQLFIEKQLPEIKLTYAVEEVAAASNTSAVFQKGLAVRFAYSPDFSTVNSGFFKIGNNSAFLVEYRFNNRFVIQSGVIKSVKKYSANPADYKWPEQWGQTPNSLTDITATCDMLDIPLNLRFDISQKPNQRLFVTAGATSYLMLNELYEYGYYGSSGALLSSWEGKTGFYAFSVLNFAAGFEKSISRKISLQVEPFVKLPVRDLGFGKVRLTTLGVFASAKIKL